MFSRGLLINSWLARIAAFGLLAPLALAHVVSVSTGELRVDGTRGQYELRMPAYEVSHVSDPATTLLDQIRFEGAERVSGSCELDADAYLCRAEFVFSGPIPDQVTAECTLYEVTVPNHVHLLYASQGNNSDQVVLDQTAPEAVVRFHPPSFGEVLWRDGAAGIGQLLASVSGLLFLAALALASRDRKEALILGAGFVIAEWVARPLALAVPMGFSDTFLEAAMALTVAYLAAEILLLPSSGSRWIIAPLLGLVHGLAFAAFPPGYLAGATLAQLAGLALVFFIATGLPHSARRIASGVVLAAAVLWFAVLLVL